MKETGWQTEKDTDSSGRDTDKDRQSRPDGLKDRSVGGNSNGEMGFYTGPVG